uniref:Uncharacterized protein n=1 Tax=Parascaris univalens TaxID=6257 RepID=A0A915CAE2_PARUN
LLRSRLFMMKVAAKRRTIVSTCRIHNVDDVTDHSIFGFTTNFFVRFLKTTVEIIGCSKQDDSCMQNNLEHQKAEIILGQSLLAVMFHQRRPPLNRVLHLKLYSHGKYAPTLRK